MHSLNAFYGGARISPKEFEDWKRQYDREYEGLRVPKCDKWDSVIGNQEDLVSFVIRKTSQLGTLYIPPGYMEQTLKLWKKTKLTQLIDKTTGSCFVFNADHIWMMKYQNNKWYTLDSLRGVRVCDPERLSKTKTLGFIPILSKAAMLDVLSMIKGRIQRLLYNQAPRNSKSKVDKLSIKRFVKSEIKARRYISKVELDVCVYFRLFGIVHPEHLSRHTFKAFFVSYQRHAADISILVQFVPPLLHFICVT
jgi:hypothetical protein